MPCTENGQEKRESQVLHDLALEARETVKIRQQNQHGESHQPYVLR